MAIRFYAACLASYNNGVLHGAWIDAESDVDAMQEQVNAMLRKSRFPNVTVDCVDCGGDGVEPAPALDAQGRVPVCETCKGACKVPSAEEFAIHDSEGLPRSFGEFCGLQAIADYVEFVEEVEEATGRDGEEAEELARAMLDNWHDIDSARSELDNFCGVYDSFREYADESADEVIACHSADGKAPQFLINYFDYESYARDLSHEMTALDLSDGVAVFHQ
ncbi:antirestriction protein ArdA [Aquamicrobium zhengzhouense]|uniref:Antirestriction protein ArdA n=1 Tax=Aquamicrobium zhengzhouense TaxID=2781738 RepID=A0ABS0S9V3_9HYPH|nr:antirestriction protein ArdA [Aquamicrobium zhengzhouense]MBI1620073.1 antirestriction protein ArdA [Aquamicrobium zhengzhouense]